MKIYQKLKEARDLVRSGKYKKDGTNTYSKYDYFTPEMVEHIVSDVTDKTNTICICNLKADEYGIYQEMIFQDLEDDSNITFQLRTERGDMKATNTTQQMGGTDTYSERYIKMKVFQIKDNNLDFDSHDHRETVQEPQKATISPKQALEGAKKAITDSTTLEELNSIGDQIKNSKNIPDRRSQEGKDMRNELAQIFADKAKELSSKEVPFE